MKSRFKIHEALDYFLGVLLLFGPWIFAVSDVPSAAANFRTLGAILILYALVSDTKLGAFHWMPFHLHRVFDLVGGVWLMGAPVIFHYKQDLSAAQYLAHIGIGLIWTLNGLLTYSVESPPEHKHHRKHYRKTSAAVPVTGLSLSLALLALVVWTGTRVPSVSSEQAGTRGESHWQTGEGYVPPQDHEGATSTQPAAQQNVDPSKATQSLDVKSDPDAASFHPRRLQVEAGSTACIRFENQSRHNHSDNLMIVEPGTERKVGIAAQAAGDKRGFIPVLPNEIIAHTRTLAPGESENLCFNVPSKPGRYPFVSTVRNRWEAMKGTLEVTEPKKATG